MRPLTVQNPYDGSVVAEKPYSTDAEIARALSHAQDAFLGWRRSPAHERAKLLLDVAAELEQDQEGFAELIRDEAGKPITFARAEVARALNVLRWAAGEAQRFGGELLRLDAFAGGRPGFGIHQKFARGVILGITPFNFPLNLVLHKVAPAVASGNAILVKPSPFAPLTSLRLTALFEKFRPGIVQTVLASDEQTARLTRAPEVAMVSFTGSEAVGGLVRDQARGKPVTLELGGNAWCAVLKDTPPDLFAGIARKIATGAFGYAGQSCISVQNVAIEGEVFAEFLEALRSATRATPYGDPRDPATISGPLIHAGARAKIETQLQRFGERVVSEQRIGERELLAPTLVEIRDEGEERSALVQEEVFGPVMTARSFRGTDELLTLSGSGRYGLQAGVFTQNLAAIETLFQDLEVGGLVVNDVPTSRQDHQPYGGLKESGQGREGVRYAMEEMTESKFLALSSLVAL